MPVSKGEISTSRRQPRAMAWPPPV